MASTHRDGQHDLSESSVMMHSDSETYDANNEHSESPPSDESSPLILYTQPTVWSLLRSAAINLVLPFINGLMLGFGELFAHEIAFNLGWSETKVFPRHRNSRPIGPGIEVRENPYERKRRDGEELDSMTALE
ncbi:MAG: hypothetical protein M1820_004694 [Bogoriella megaspora]|nr:MAG: hypothetical protein M1820_004694 [Bogoriella megaspora]